MKRPKTNRILHMSYHPRFIFLSIILCISSLCHSHIAVNPNPVANIINPNARYTLINSVDYHPQKNMFCVTYTQSNKVGLYKIKSTGETELVQMLSNPVSLLSTPQHAAFSPDGCLLAVANWANETLALYKADNNGLFNSAPQTIIKGPKQLEHPKPHGITFSPCGNFLAIAYGASSIQEKALGLFRVTNKGKPNCELLQVLHGEDKLPGIPKGIAFSPDGTCLLVTFSDVNSLVIYDLCGKNTSMIQSTPRQIVQGKETGISRPEDIKMTADGAYCAISNSDINTVTFYHYDKKTNTITSNTPAYTLGAPEAKLCTPHGLAFSPDGRYLLITQFGPITVTETGEIHWPRNMPQNHAHVTVFQLTPSP